MRHHGFSHNDLAPVDPPPETVGFGDFAAEAGGPGTAWVETS